MLSRQRILRTLLFYLAARIPALRQTVHLDALFGLLGRTEQTSTAARAKIIADLQPMSMKIWFRQAEHRADAVALDLLANGWSYARLP